MTFPVLRDQERLNNEWKITEMGKWCKQRRLNNRWREKRRMEGRMEGRKEDRKTARQP